MSTENKVSVIIPTYNRAPYIAESIASMISQTYPPTQIIVSDDGSTDNTADVVRQFGSVVTYIRKENGGKSSALNHALPYLNGDFVWIFDDDDYAYPDAIYKHIKTHQKNPELGFTFGFHDYGITGEQGKIRKTESPATPLLFSSEISNQRINLLKYSAFMLSSCIIRRYALEKAGLFREDLHRSQDYDMLIRISQLYDFAYTGSPTYIIRKHDGLRGPETIRHDNAHRGQMWRKYDYMIGQSIVDSVPLHRYLSPQPKSENLDPVERRTALIRRAWVMASKANPKQLISDLLEAESATTASIPLTPGERECCYSICDHPYFLMCLYDEPDCLHPLIHLTGSAIGSEMLKCLGKGLYWIATDRNKDISLNNRIRILGTATHLLLLGFRGGLAHG